MDLNRTQIFLGKDAIKLQLKRAKETVPLHGKRLIR